MLRAWGMMMCLLCTAASAQADQQELDDLLSHAAPLPEPKAQREVDPRCDVMFDQAITHMARQQYPTMYEVAEESTRICPGARSSFILGLSLANLFDAGLAKDPAEREQFRVRGIQALRRAAEGGSELSGAMRSKTHEWLVYLKDQGPPVTEDEVEEPATPDLSWIKDEQDTSIPLRVPPPRPKASAPWGPVIVGGSGVVALGTAIATAIAAANNRAAVDEALGRIDDPMDLTPDVLNQLQDKEDTAKTFETVTTGLLIGGGAALTAAAIWYFVLPPDGGWQWAVSPGGLQVTARF